MDQLLKNVKSVVVPYTGGQNGLQIAIAVGIVGGKADAVLEILSDIPEEQQPAIQIILIERQIEIEVADNDHPFFIDITE